MEEQNKQESQQPDKWERLQRALNKEVSLEDVQRRFDVDRQLREAKEEILANASVFETYGFYMPEFEETIESINDLPTANHVRAFFDRTVPGVGDEVVPFMNGNNRTIEIAGHFIAVRLERLFERLSISPKPHIVISGERANMKAHLHISTEHEDKLIVTEYQNTLEGHGEPIYKIYKRAIWNSFSESDFNPFYDFIQIDPSLLDEPRTTELHFIRPAVLLDKRSAFALNNVKDAIQGAIYAYWENKLECINDLLNAGKSIAEIQAEIMPKEAEKNLKELESSTPEKPLETAQIDNGPTLQNRIEWIGTAPEFATIIKLLEEKGFLQLPLNPKGKAEYLRRFFSIKTDEGNEVSHETLRNYFGKDVSFWSAGEVRIPYSKNVSKRK